MEIEMDKEYLEMVKRLCEEQYTNIDEEAEKRLERMKSQIDNNIFDISNQPSNLWEEFIQIYSKIRIFNFVIQIQHINDKYSLMIWEELGTEYKPYVRKLKVLYDKRFDKSEFKNKWNSEHNSKPLNLIEVKNVLVWLKVITKLVQFM